MKKICLLFIALAFVFVAPMSMAEELDIIGTYQGDRGEATITRENGTYTLHLPSGDGESIEVWSSSEEITDNRLYFEEKDNPEGWQLALDFDNNSGQLEMYPGFEFATRPYISMGAYTKTADINTAKASEPATSQAVSKEKANMASLYGIYENGQEQAIFYRDSREGYCLSMSRWFTICSRQEPNQNYEWSIANVSAAKNYYSLNGEHGGNPTVEIIFDPTATATKFSARSFAPDLDPATFREYGTFTKVSDLYVDLGLTAPKIGILLDATSDTSITIQSLATNTKSIFKYWQGDAVYQDKNMDVAALNLSPGSIVEYSFRRVNVFDYVYKTFGFQERWQLASLKLLKPTEEGPRGEKPLVMQNLQGVWRGDAPNDVIGFDMQLSPYSDEGKLFGFFQGDLYIPILSFPFRVDRYDDDSIHFYTMDSGPNFSIETDAAGNTYHHPVGTAKSAKFSVEIDGDTIVLISEADLSERTFYRVEGVYVPKY